MEVFLASPWVPAEWITAHGLKPRGIWFEPGLEKGAGQASAGVCAFARNVLQFAQASYSTTIFSTQCDQLRRAYDEAAETPDNRAPTSSRVFLFNLPATWQTPAAEKMVRCELERLSHFLVRLGGHRPSAEEMAEACDRARLTRVTLAEGAESLYGAAYAHALAMFHATGLLDPALRSHIGRANAADAAASVSGLEKPGPIHLALIGGPFCRSDWPFLDEVEALNGRIVLNGTETGERTVNVSPGAADSTASITDPALITERLARDVLDRCVDVFQRPNTPLYDWLAERLARRKVKGIILWEHVGCDLWRAEAESLREVFKLPILVMEAGEATHRSPRNAGRLQAFIETLRS